MHKLEQLYKQQRIIIDQHMVDVYKSAVVAYCFNAVCELHKDSGIKPEYIVLKSRLRPLPECKQALSYLLRKIVPSFTYADITAVIYPFSVRGDHTTIIHNVAEFYYIKNGCEKTQAWYDNVVANCPYEVRSGDPAVRHRSRAIGGVHIFYNALGRPYSNNEIPRAFEKFQTLGTNFIHNKRKDSKLF